MTKDERPRAFDQTILPPNPPPPSTLDWDGPDDSDNPRNFSLRRRIASTIAVTLLAFVSTLAASIYSPSHVEVSRLLNVSEEVAILPLSLYNVGLAFGPLVGAPLSETFGRKAVFLSTTPIFGLFILGAGLSQNATSLSICRFFAGVFASPAISNASATIIDYTAGRYRAISLAFYYSIPFFGAVFGPLLGGLVLESRGWRWTQWVTLFFLVAAYLPILFIKETYKKTILERRARGTTIERDPTSLYAATTFFISTLLVRPLHMMLTETIVTLVCLYNGFLFGLMYTFVIASPWVFEHYYDFDLVRQSLSFLGLMAGTGLAPFPLILIDLYMYQPRLKRYRQQNSNTSSSIDERFPPEHRLYPSLIASFILPVSLAVFGWTAHLETHWIIPILFQGIAIMSTVLIYASASTFMMDSYGPLYGASAAGAAMFARYAMSAAFPLFALRMYVALGVGWATSILAFCTLAMAPIPWLFWKFGQKLREKVKYEMST
ncbi:hypothetical protein B0A52_03128 [Exophiala mesophila]|uniref:Major facilitator superfamily (MFS) profile domain-containing protein n=1 Tax=Exophiala mesophila TaxID=212818 RepID=A0A438NCK0_EXOME|nr:hypothetical protein B0A52_03128 [Exophiala mesophila]